MQEDSRQKKMQPVSGCLGAITADDNHHGCCFACGVEVLDWWQWFRAQWELMCGLYGEVVMDRLG